MIIDATSKVTLHIFDNKLMWHEIVSKAETYFSCSYLVTVNVSVLTLLTVRSEGLYCKILHPDFTKLFGLFLKNWICTTKIWQKNHRTLVHYAALCDMILKHFLNKKIVKSMLESFEFLEAFDCTIIPQ